MLTALAIDALLRVPTEREEDWRGFLAAVLPGCRLGAAEPQAGEPLRWQEEEAWRGEGGTPPAALRLPLAARVGVLEAAALAGVLLPVAAAAEMRQLALRLARGDSVGGGAAAALARMLPAWRQGQGRHLGQVSWAGLNSLFLWQVHVS